MRKNKKPAYAKEEFVEELLPRNRKEQLKFILKTRKSLIAILGGILLAFSIPILIALLYKDNFVYNFYILYTEGKLNENGFLLMTAENNIMFTGICAGCLLVYDVALAAVFNVIKKLVFGDPIFLKNDLLHGVKINIVSFLTLTAILGGFLTLLALTFRFLFFDVFFIIILVIFVLFIFPYFAGLFFYKSIYKASFKETLFNGLFLFRAAGIKGILLLLGLVVIPVTFNILAETLVITAATNMIINIIYFLVVLPVYLLILYCFYYSIFDDRLNSNCFPDYYRRGLYRTDLVDEDLLNEKKDEE